MGIQRENRFASDCPDREEAHTEENAQVVPSIPHPHSKHATRRLPCGRTVVFRDSTCHDVTTSARQGPRLRQRQRGSQEHVHGQPRHGRGRRRVAEPRSGHGSRSRRHPGAGELRRRANRRGGRPGSQDQARVPADLVVLDFYCVRTRGQLHGTRGIVLQRVDACGRRAVGAAVAGVLPVCAVNRYAWHYERLIERRFHRATCEPLTA